MESFSSYRPRVSRETRLLLTTGAASILALWMLARIRFDDPALTSNPVAPVLHQLADTAHFDSLATELADVQSRVRPALVTVDLAPDHARRLRAAGLRWKDFALVVLPEGSATSSNASAVRALDRATRLAVVNVPGASPSAPLAQWTPRQPDRPRYLAVTGAAAGATADVPLRPIFVASLVSKESPLWSGEVWTVPAGSALTAGSFVFTTAGEFVGLVDVRDGEVAIVPGPTLLAEADRLLLEMPHVPATLQLEVQALTTALESLTGASAGVVVAWVHTNGPAGALAVGDVIEAVDGHELRGRGDWDARMARLQAGEALTLRVRRSGHVQDVAIRAAAEPGRPPQGAGFSLRRQAGLGSVVTRVDPASAASQAGLSTGDVITLFGQIEAPTPLQITRTFAALRPGGRLMVAVTRGDSHHVLVLER